MKIRVGEKLVPVEALQPAGVVFDPHPKVPRHKRQKPWGWKTVKQPRDSHLHRLADAYRPKETNDV